MLFSSKSKQDSINLWDVVLSIVHSSNVSILFFLVEAWFSTTGMFMFTYGKYALPTTWLLLCLIVSSAVNASTWILIGSSSGKILIPVASLSNVSAPTFNYGNSATITLGSFGSTSAIYFRRYTWQGNATTGGFSAPSVWECHDLATLNNNNQSLKISFDGLASGRYKYDVAAVMVQDTCDVAAYEADDLVASEVYTSNEFMMLKHDTLSAENSKIVQNPKLLGNQKNSYDLHLKWLTVDGAEHYQLNLKKDHVPHYFDVDDATYRAQLALNNRDYYKIEDSYNQATSSYTPYTGFGNYNFSIKYCFKNDCSKDFDYIHSDPNTPYLNVKPLMPESFWINTTNNYTVA